MPTLRRRTNTRAAVVDIGSGTVNLAVFERRRAGLALVEEHAAPLRLLASVRDGALAPDALDAAVATIVGFVEAARAIGAEELEIVGTSALRDVPPRFAAELPGRICQPLPPTGGSGGRPDEPVSPSDMHASLARVALDRRLQDAIGVGLRVIDGDDEATCAARAVLHTLPVVDALVADLGGGSLQLAEIRDRRVRRVASAPIGALRLLLANPLPDPPDADTLTAMRRAADGALAAVEWLREAPGMVVGCGGTFRTLARIDRRERAAALAHPHGQRLRADAVESLLERASRSATEARATIPGLPGHRVDVIVPGALVVARLLQRVRADEARTASVGIREGVLLGRAPSELDAVRARGLRLRFADAPMPHADQRAGAALALFDTVAPADAAELSTVMRAAAWLDAVWTLFPPEGGPLAALLGAPVSGFFEEELYAIADALSDVPRGQLAPDDRERVRLLLELARAEVEGDPQLRGGAVRVRVRGHVHADVAPRFRRAFARTLEVVRPGSGRAAARA